MPGGSALQALRMDMMHEREMADELQSILRGLRREADAIGRGQPRQNTATRRHHNPRRNSPRHNHSHSILDDTLSISTQSQPPAARGSLRGVPAPSPAPSPLTPPLPHRGKGGRDVTLFAPNDKAPTTLKSLPISPHTTHRSSSPPSPLLSPASFPPQQKWRPLENATMPHVPSPSPSPMRETRRNRSPPALRAAPSSIRSRTDYSASLHATPLSGPQAARVSPPRPTAATAGSATASAAGGSPGAASLTLSSRRSTSHGTPRDGPEGLLPAGGLSPVVAPADAAAAAAAAAASGASPIAEVMQSLTALGPFRSALFHEVVRAFGAKGVGNPALERYNEIIQTRGDVLRHDFAALAAAQGMVEAEFLTHCYVRQASVPMYTARPFRIAVVGAPDAGVQHLLRAVADRVMEVVVHPSLPLLGTFVFPVDWALVLPSMHRGVDLANFYCRLVQHVVAALAVFAPELRSHASLVVTFWKKLVSQHHLPTLPDVHQRAEEVEGIRALAARVQHAYHEGRAKDFARAMFLLPHVLADSLGLSHTVLVYRRMELLETASFQLAGAPVSEAVLLGAAMHSMSACEASVVLSLSHRSNVELNAAWITLGLEYLATPSDVSKLVPQEEVAAMVQATRGCPAYIDTILRSRKRVKTASLRATDEPVLLQKRQQLMFLEDTVSAVMQQIDTLAGDIAAHESQEQMKNAHRPVRDPSRSGGY